ncbi:carbohydrate-binding protein [Granulicella sp. S156]|uniref:carbohydrate-binding protein n=1 Tax=Granulicella sp. S156 TaxID=1747224 RepID=UPI00131DA818|nr:carbohydrate-binding protein [Granulicella sp. S156]
MKNRTSRIAVVMSQSIVLMFVALFATGSSAFAQNNTIFGPNVYVFTPSDSVSSINSTLSTLAGYTQFDTSRAAVLFEPGTYTGVQAEVGFYESVAGLGETPTAVSINQGYLTVNTTDSNGNLTTNFWRSLENMSIAVPAADESTLQWGVSQGTSFRRINVTGGVELANTDCGEASGGFISDSVITGVLNACSQQQWYTRNSSIGSFTGYVWNYVFSGVVGAPAQSNPFSNDAENVQDTVLATTPVVREKPYLYMDSSGNYWVFSPSLRTNSTGADWSNGGLGAGTSLPISSFYIATPSSTLAAINAALASGQNLILTPGIYQYSGPINVTNANTVVLGIGYADLVPQTGTAALTVADVDGVQLAGFLIDAGPVNSPVLLQIGVNGAPRVSHASNPTSISDVSFRIGGATTGTATTSMEIDSDNVILDNIWAWRADHGTDATWTGNVAMHGLVVNGDNVTALGLAVEHFEAEQVIWNGENGETIFYQSEMPYDVPSQSAWMDGSVDGYASYNVSPGVTNHKAYGIGVYSYFDQGVNIVANSGIAAPVSVGVTFTDALTVFLNGSGQITNTIASNNSSVDNAGTTVNTGNSISDVSAWGGTNGSCTAVPSTPGTPSATGTSTSTINVAWVASSEGSSCTLSYNLFRSTTSGFTPSLSNMIASDLTTASFTDSGLALGTIYYYAVQAANGDGSSAVSAEGSGTTTGSGGGTSSGSGSGSGGSTSYTYGVADDSTSLVVSFTGTPTCENVILSYVLNGGSQLNVQMTVSGDTFSYTIPGVTAGAAETLSYYFTYVQSTGAQFGPTTTYTWTRGSGGGTTPGGEGPYNGTAAAIPGIVQAENYDTGGQSVAYNVTSINGTANSYRSDGVDLEATTDTGGGYDLGWTTAGQSFNYTVNVATAATYTVTFRVATPSAVSDAFHISNSSGTNLSGSVAVPATGGWQTWTNVTATVTLPAGQQTLIFNQDAAGWNLNSFSFASGSGTGTANCSGVSGITVGSTTYAPQWCQEFNGAAGSPDTTVWNFDLGNNSGWGNNEVEVYCGPPGYAGNPSQCPTTFSTSTAPVYTDGNGHLVIQPINVGGTWISGRMNTEGLENFQYGIIEASIQVPNTTSQGLWPAFWSLGSNIGTVGWPTSGEADFMEDWSTQVDSGPGPAGFKSTIHTALTGGDGVGDVYDLPSGQATDTAYHTYGIIWTPNEMQFFIDDPATPFFTTTPSSLPSGDTWPFNANIFLLLNVAVGGTLGGSTANLSNPQPMMVDYVRYYTAP